MKPRYLVDLPAERYAPPEVRAQLREIDPVAELVCIDGRTWLLGRVAPNRERYELGAYMARLELDFPYPDFGALREAQLLMQGFALVEQYELQGEPDSRIVEDFRRRSYVYATDRRSAIRAATDATAGLSDEEKMRLRGPMARYKAQHAARWAFAKPHSVNMGGHNPLNPN